jgi:hypothetical protein
MRQSESLMNSIENSCQQGVLISEDSCGFFYHVNEYDDKLKTCTILKEDQKNILIIGGIEVFLRSNPLETEGCVAEAATKGGQSTETVMEEELEQTLMFSQAEGEDHSAELLKIFSQEAEQEIIIVLEPTAEEEANNMDFANLWEELEALEKRVMVQILHIQQI